MAGTIQGLHTGAASDIFEYPFQFFLTPIGDNTGVRNHNVNYAAAKVDAFYKATARYDLHTALVSISDNATFNQTDYGGIVTGTVVNGIKFYVDLAGQPRRYLMSGYPAIANADWHSLTRNVQLTTYAGSSQTLSIAFLIAEDYGTPLILMPGESFGVELHDNFSGLVVHTFGIRGILHI
jgi:hypothetical protein